MNLTKPFHNFFIMGDKNQLLHTFGMNQTISQIFNNANFKSQNQIQTFKPKKKN